MLYNHITGEKRVLPPAPFKPWLDGIFTVLDDGGAGCVVMNTYVKTQHFAFCFSCPGAEAEWKVYVRPATKGITMGGSTPTHPWTWQHWSSTLPPASSRPWCRVCEGTNYMVSMVITWHSHMGSS
jgi:hypothetical protein